MTTDASAKLKQTLGTGRHMTGQRRVIADVIQTARDHPDANEGHRRAAAQVPKISLSTAYRTLRLLAQVGLIEQHAGGCLSRFSARRRP
jgi:Fur family ferric uptake transcriptional regulator